MDNAVVRGIELRNDVIAVPDGLWRNLGRLASGATSCLGRHSERVRTDPGYREAVEHLTELLSALPGRWGQAVRIAAAGHALMVKVL